ncbi:MAG: hypothetical protein V3V68_04990 [Nitrosomonadaceae bacterium]
MLEDKDKAYGILHDAAEYIWGDLCSPLKRELPSYRAAISGLQAKIYSYYSLSVYVPETVRAADLKIKQWEYENYVIKEGDAWSPEYSRLRFLDAFLANFATM